VDPPPCKGLGNVLRLNIFNNFSESPRGGEEVYQAPMTIVTRLIIERMLLRSSDQGEVLIQPNLQKEDRGSKHKKSLIDKSKKEGNYT
jgi:hypothetical protein